MSNHSIIEHRANYHFIKLEDDYLAVCKNVNKEVEAFGLPNRQSSGPADCKGMILSVLEHWMNSKRHAATCGDDLYVYLTYDEWEQQIRGRYGRSVIIRCLKEMELEGEWLDDKGEMHTGLIKSQPHVQNTFKYVLNIPVVQALVSALPEQSPFNPKPKVILGRPKKDRSSEPGFWSPDKNRSEINGLKTNDIKINGLKTDDIMEIPSKNERNNPIIPSKNERSFYTQINNTDLTKTQISSGALAPAPRALSEEIERVSPLVAPKTRMKPGRKCATQAKADLFASASPETQAIATEWRAIFKTPVPITAKLMEHATALAAYQPVPGEIAACRLWMYQNDKNKWYSSHGMNLGDVAREFERFRSLASMPEVAAPKGRQISSFDDPDYDMSSEFYPSPAEKASRSYATC